MDDNKKLKQSGSDSGKEVDGKSESAQKEQPRIPEASFSLFMSSLVTQALISLGEVENPFSEKSEPNLDQAKFTIDTLEKFFRTHLLDISRLNPSLLYLGCITDASVC